MQLTKEVGATESSLPRSGERAPAEIYKTPWVLVGLIGVSTAFFYMLCAYIDAGIRLGQATSTNFDGVISMMTGSGSIRFSRDAGSERPLITSEDGKPLIEFSDWASTIFVGETSSSLWQLPHSYAVDPDRRRIFHNTRGPDWELQKVVSVSEPSKVLVEYYFMPTRAGLGQVGLTVNHFNWWFSQVSIGKEGFTAVVPKGSRYEIVRGENTEPAYEVSVRILSGLPADPIPPVRLTIPTEFGTSNVVVAFVLSDPAFNRRVKLAAEEVTWKPYGS